jgi:hypothetical protein
MLFASVLKKIVSCYKLVKCLIATKFISFIELFEFLLLRQNFFSSSRIFWPGQRKKSCKELATNHAAFKKALAGDLDILYMSNVIFHNDMLFGL